MKNMFNPVKDEKGLVLFYVVLVLVLAALLIPPLLQFGFGAHRSATIREERMLNVYAADAGIEDAFYRLKFESGNQAGNYSIADINGYQVNYEIMGLEGKGQYRITSTASSDISGNVTIVTHTQTVDYKGMLDNALTSKGDVEIGSGSKVIGTISLNGDLDLKGDLTCCESCDPPKSGMECVDDNVPVWPTKEELGWPPRVVGSTGEDYYWTAGVASNTCASGTLNVGENANLYRGPCHTTGSLTITGKNKNPGNLTLLGNLYIQGDLIISANAADGLHLYLDSKTIYVEGKLDMGQGLVLHGPGVIAAVGTIKFMPNVIGTDGYIFVISISKDLQVQPSGNFMGAMAGITSVDLQPGNTLTWIDYKDEGGNPIIDFPPGTGYGLRIEDYIIDPPA